MANPVPPVDPITGALRDYTSGEISLMGIQHVGVSDGAHPTIVRRVNESTYTAAYFCAYNELESFVCYMLGAALKYVDSGVDTLSRMVPFCYPGKNVFFAVALDEATGYRYTGQQEADGRPIYTKWLCHFVFQHLPFLVAADGVVSFEYQRYLQELPSSAQPEYVSLPSGILKFVTSGGGPPTGNTIQHNIGFVNSVVQVKKKWIRVPYEAYQAGSTLRTRVYGDIESGEDPWLGTINTTQIMGYAPGQLLLTAVEEELMLDPVLEEQHWNLTFVFLARSVSHNWFKFFDPAGLIINQWCFVSNNGTYYDTSILPDGKSLFNGRDHKGLFAIGTYP